MTILSWGFTDEALSATPLIMGNQAVMSDTWCFMILVSSYISSINSSPNCLLHMLCLREAITASSVQQSTLKHDHESTHMLQSTFRHNHQRSGDNHDSDSVKTELYLEAIKRLLHCFCFGEAVIGSSSLQSLQAQVYF